MKIALFDKHRYEEVYFERERGKYGYDLSCFETRLNSMTAQLGKGHEVVCCFVNDELGRETLTLLANQGTKLIALRSAGFNHVDLDAAEELGLDVVRVPEYSPYAVAEFATTLLLTVNRKIHRSYTRAREMNFSLEGLEGFDLHNKTVGIIGTGKIGRKFAKIMAGFGCQILAFDQYPNQEMTEQFNAKYCESLEEIYKKADVISLHIPLTPETHHLLNAKAFEKMKKGVLIVNTSRGGLIDTKALIDGLKSKHIGGAGLDVYEEEEKYFFQDLSDQVLQDDTLARLLTFPNVVITSHQGFFTKEALSNIASTTFSNIHEFEKGKPLTNKVCKGS